MPRRRKPAPEPGTKIGMWTVLREAQRNRSRGGSVVARCACGREKIVRVANLKQQVKRGAVPRCATCAGRKIAEDHPTMMLRPTIGDRYGEWTVVAVLGLPDRRGRRVLVACSCGSETEKLLTKLQSNAAKGVKTCCLSCAAKRRWARHRAQEAARGAT